VKNRRKSAEEANADCSCCLLLLSFFEVIKYI